MGGFRRFVIGSVLAFPSVFLALKARAIVMEWVYVGDPGNAGDTALMKQDQTSGYGAVGYSYQIGKYDVTNAQYAEFLNAKDPTGANTLGLYNGTMSTDGNSAGISFDPNGPNGGKYGVLAGQGNKPITNVTWFSSLRFANWLNNGQGNGDTESGAYTLTGGSPTPANASSIARNPGANIFLPSENEWYKAAYYKGGGTNAGYWTYATQHNTPPVSAPPSPTASNNANYNDKNTGFAVTGSTSYSTGQNYLTDVGSYGNSPSAYGTFDQTGDVFQWNEAQVSSSGARGIRGGSWNLDDGALPSTNRDLLYDGNYANFFIGFRVASSNPEPTGTSVLLIGGGVTLLHRRRGKRTFSIRKT